MKECKEHVADGLSPDTLKEARELIRSMKAVPGEIRRVDRCRQCRELVARRFIPYAKGAGYILRMCACPGRNWEGLVESDP
jgi:hypothetical protein